MTQRLRNLCVGRVTTAVEMVSGAKLGVVLLSALCVAACIPCTFSGVSHFTIVVAQMTTGVARATAGVVCFMRQARANLASNFFFSPLA